MRLWMRRRSEARLERIALLICRLLLPSARFHSKMGNCSRTMFEGLGPIRQLQKNRVPVKEE